MVEQLPHILDHYVFLQHLHERLKPSVYLETGVESGRTLQLAKCQAIGIDPQPNLQVKLSDDQNVYQQTSDEFFSSYEVKGLTGGMPIDLAFIDGLHTFDAALRDFINIEKSAHAGTVVCIHDVIPQTVKMASRDPQPDGWTGDVFGLILALREHRPNLFTTTIELPPTGMLIVSNLDPYDTTLRDNFDTIFFQHLSINYSKLHSRRHDVLKVAPYSEAITEFLVGNMELDRARRKYQGVRDILKGDPRIRLGAWAGSQLS